MRYRISFSLLILLLIPSMGSFAFDNTQAVTCQLDLSSALTAIQTAQQAIDSGDKDTALHTVSEARNILQLLEDKCMNYAPKEAGNSRTNPVPFGQQQHAELGNKFSGSIELVNYIDDAEDYIRQARTDSETDPAPEGTRYIVFRVKYKCEKTTSESCDFSRGYFSTVGDKGLVYDYSSIKSRLIIPIGDDKEIFGGAEIEVDIPFLVEVADSNFVLFTDYSSDSRVFFASNKS